jgi:hypothetical protein
MQTRGVEADRGAHLGIERGAKRQMAADAVAHRAQLVSSYLRMPGQIIQRRSAVLIEDRYRRFGGVVLSARPTCIVEWNRGACWLYAMIDLRRRSHESIARQPSHQAQRGSGELKDIRITNDSGVFPRRLRRSHKHAHGRAAGRDVDIAGGDYHLAA